jgi:hypothetical protein
VKLFEIIGLVTLVAFASLADAQAGRGGPPYRAAPGFRVEIDSLPDAVPVGASAPCDFTLINARKEGVRLLMDAGGHPAPILPVILDADGNANALRGKPLLATAAWRTPQSSAGVPRDETYPWAPGEKIRFHYDLMQLADVASAKPGKWTVSFDTRP